MNISESQCVNCPAKRACEQPQTMPDGSVRTQTCPPQDKAVKLNDPTASNEDIKQGLSRIRQDVYVTYHCPKSERELFIDPLERQVDPNRTKTAACTPSHKEPVDYYALGINQDLREFGEKTRTFVRGQALRVGRS